MPETTPPARAPRTRRHRRRTRYRRGLDARGERLRHRMAGAGLQRGLRRVRRAARRWQRQLAGMRTRVAVVLGLLTLVVGSALAWRWLGEPPREDRAWSRVPPGQSHDGIPLPAGHRMAAALPPDDDPAEWLEPAAAAPSSAAPSAAPPAAPSATKAPPRVAGLAMHYGCAWGQPGRNPYRGTPEQALAAARLPPDVVKAVAQRIRARERSDRVTITNAGIRRHTTGEEYNAQRFTMSFGRSLCVDSRVNFVPGHREEADLYEVADGQGRVHAVMVPDVCGNVSVLGTRGEDEFLLAHADAQERHSVPLPGTLAHVLLGLLMAGAVRWWRRRGR